MRPSLINARASDTATPPPARSQGCGGLRTRPALEKLVEMAARTRFETERHLYRFREAPADFQNSEAFFRMVMMGVVLTEDFDIRYNPQRRATPADTKPDDGFFHDPQVVFLSGLLGPSRRGTCSSLPVLYVAVGRHLGYPLKLVANKGHLFVRWEGNGDRLNLEVTGHGVNRFEDDYYRHWPFEITPEEEKAEGYLKSLTPSEELAAFLSIRGLCLRDAARIPDAAEAFASAASLAPNCRSYRRMLTNLQKTLHDQPALAVAPQPTSAPTISTTRP